MSYSKQQIQGMVEESAIRQGVDPRVALAIAQHESGFNPDAINVNNKGTANETRDWGVMQLNDLTVRTLGLQNPLEVQGNIDAGVSLLAKYQMKYDGDLRLMLWAYASGPGAVAKGGEPNPVAKEFISYVMNRAPILRSEGPLPETPATAETPGSPEIPAVSGFDEPVTLSWWQDSDGNISNWVIALGGGVVGLGIVAWLLGD